jgi:hypothetical protein
MVEAVIVASLLALFMACTVFFHRLYSKKVTSMLEARQEAWMGALPGCSGGLGMGLLNSFGAITALNEADDAGLVDAPDWMGNTGRSVGQPEAVTVQSGPLLGGRAFRLTTRTSIACNEYGDDEANDSLLASLVQHVRDMVDSR